MSLYAVTRFYPTFILFSVAWLTTLLVPQYAGGLSDTSISQPLILLLAYTILVVSDILIYLGLGWAYAFYVVAKLAIIMGAHSEWK
jgi:hypothetical protein